MLMRTSHGNLCSVSHLNIYGILSFRVSPVDGKKITESKLRVRITIREYKQGLKWG